MFSDPLITNAFIADGIVPEKYGYRTLLEYRARLFSVPPSSRTSAAPPGDHMDIITPAGQSPDAARRAEPHPLSTPRAPDVREGEDSLHALANSLDLTALGPLHPTYFAVMSVVPPAYMRRSALALQRQERERAVVDRDGNDINDNTNTNDNDNNNYKSVNNNNNTAIATFRTLVARSLHLLRSTVIARMFLGNVGGGRDTEPILLSWHWFDDFLAVSTGSDLDRVCAYHFHTGQWELSGERHHALVDMRCIAFRPYSGRVLAIGGRHGIALLERQVLRALSGERHTNICSLDWSPDGLWLASASATDGTVRVWDIPTGTFRTLGYGALVRFNPNKDKQMLFVADATGVSFRLWNLRTWTTERWGSLSGPVVAAAWSHDGSTLLFSTLKQSCIHILSLARDKTTDASLSNIEMTTLPREGPGGTPILLELDPTSERLAVVYEVPQEESSDIESSPLVREDIHRRFAVALYATQFNPTCNVTPVGYVSGPTDSGPPVAIKFKPAPVGNAGATLACMWRSGQITFTHLFFTPSRKC